VQIHKQREETIKNMRAITRELLKSFYRKSGAKPANIIMYRDGVGEGHFDIVMRWEGRSWPHATAALLMPVQPSKKNVACNCARELYCFRALYGHGRRFVRVQSPR
jgi:hypothetical protein